MTMRIDFDLNGIIAAKDKDEFEKAKKAVDSASASKSW